MRLVRKVLLQLSQKNREFVALSLKFEKNAAQQVISDAWRCNVKTQPTYFVG